MRIPKVLLAPLVCGLALVPVSLWYDARQSAAERMAHWEERAATERSAESLTQPIELPAGVFTLGELQSQIERQANLKVEFAESLPRTRLNSGEITPFAWQVELPGGRLPLLTVLDTALNQIGLDFEFKEGVIAVAADTSTPHSSDRYVEVYPLPQPEMASTTADEEAWAELLTTVIGMQYWDTTGGTGHMEAVPGAVVVLQGAPQHRQIRRLLGEFAKLSSPPTALTPVQLSPDAAPATTARVLAALDQPSSLDCVAKRLDEVLRDLARQHHIPLVIRYSRLDEVRVERDTRVTKKVTGISLRSLLQLVLSELELTYTVSDGSLIVTTSDETGNSMRLVAYPVHDLLALEPNHNPDRLVELIITHIAPNSWSNMGSAASVHGSAIDGWLLVGQFSDVHASIERLLSQLRLLLTHSHSPRFVALESPTPGEQRILETLETPIALDYDDMPLRDAVALLSDRSEIPIFINSKKLEEVGIRTSHSVRMRFPTRPLRYQLDSMLSEIDLTWLLDDEVVLITTPDDSNSPYRLKTYLYDVAVLTDTDFGLTSADGLKKLIMEMNRPETWDRVGGPGKIDDFHGILVVSQTQDVPERLPRLLESTEQHCLARVSSPAGPPLVISPLASASELAIEKALLRTIDVQIDNVPLQQALETLAAKHQLPLLIDRFELRNNGLSVDPHVSLAVKQMTIGGVLDRLLEPHDLSFNIQYDALNITSGDDDSRRHQPRIYDLRGISGDARAEPTSERYLAELLTGLPPTAWSFAGTSMVVNDRWLFASVATRVHHHVCDDLHRRRTGETTLRARERQQLTEDLPELLREQEATRQKRAAERLPAATPEAKASEDPDPVADPFGADTE
jgi:hypothetical protein